MKIAAKVEVSTELYKNHKEAIKSDLRTTVCNELIKHDVFIEPPMTNKNGIKSMEMHFFALSYRDIDRLRELAKKYPEINKILQDIIIKV